VRHAEVSKDHAPRLEGFRLKRFHGAARSLDATSSSSTYCLEGHLRWDNAGRFEIEASAALSWPLDSLTPLVLLPCSLSVRICSVDALIRVTLPDAHCRQLEISLVQDAYGLDLEVESTIGHKAKLRNVEPVAKLIAALLRKTIEDELVWPNRIPIEIPSLSDLII